MESFVVFCVSLARHALVPLIAYVTGLAIAASVTDIHFTYKLACVVAAARFPYFMGKA